MTKRIEYSCPYIDNVKDKIQNCINILTSELDNLEKIRDINHRLRNDRNYEVEWLEDENRDLKKKIHELEYEVEWLEDENRDLKKKIHELEYEVKELEEEIKKCL